MESDRVSAGDTVRNDAASCSTGWERGQTTNVNTPPAIADSPARTANSLCRTNVELPEVSPFSHSFPSSCLGTHFLEAPASRMGGELWGACGTPSWSLEMPVPKQELGNEKQSRPAAPPQEVRATVCLRVRNSRRQPSAYSLRGGNKIFFKLARLSVEDFDLAAFVRLGTSDRFDNSAETLSSRSRTMLRTSSGTEGRVS